MVFDSKVGFIGLGNMGSALVAGLLTHGGLGLEQVVLANRSPARSEVMKARFPGTQAIEGNAEMGQLCGVIFICVRTDQVLEVLRDISPVRPGTHLVMINGGLEISQVEEISNGAVSKVIPSMTIEMGQGVSLVSHGSQVTSDQGEYLEHMLGAVSLVKNIPEGHFEVASDLTSCGPALLTEMAVKFAEAGSRHSGISGKDAWEMVLETLYATARMLREGNVSPKSLKEGVATRGGITEQGLAVLDEELPQVFDRVMERTLAKHQQVKANIKRQFLETPRNHDTVRDEGEQTPR